MIDFGFSAFFDKFENRFGRRATTAIIFLIGLAVATTCFSLILKQAIYPLFLFFAEIFPLADGGDLLVNAIVRYVLAIASFLLGMFVAYKIGAPWIQRRVEAIMRDAVSLNNKMQRDLDDLESLNEKIEKDTKELTALISEFHDVEARIDKIRIQTIE